MKAGKPVAFVLLAFLIGGAASQLPFAFADTSNPLQSIWDAISALNNKQEDLQAQIDELRTSIESDQIGSVGTEVPLSEPSVRIELEGGEQPSVTVIHLIASNSGPDNAVGVKVTLFFEMPLFDIESMSGEQCENLSRGIIQCFIGTIASDEEYPITIVANAKMLDEESNIVADISSITKDSDPSNNHADFKFVTGDISNQVSVSEHIPTEVETETNDVEEQQESESSSIDSEDMVDEQSSIQGNATRDNAENGTNSTQSSEADSSEDQSVAGEQEQGSENETSDEQGSEGTNENSDDSAEQETQSESSSETSDEQQEESQSDESDDTGSSEGDESSESGDGEESSQ